VTSNDGEHRSGLVDAAGRAAFFPARATARIWRSGLEEAADELLSSPETARLIDKAFAGSLPEDIASSLARHRVIERVVAELAASGELERLVVAALENAQTVELTERVLASAEMQLVLRQVASSRELREAIAMQTTGLADEVIAGLRASATSLDDQAERVVRRGARPEPVAYGGIATRAIALAIDAGLTTLLFMSLTGVIALIASLVGGLHPQWLVGVLVGAGWFLIAGAYFILFWSSAGQTPGMRALSLRVHGPGGRPLSLGRSFARLAGLVLAIIPLFAGFIPVLFTEKRRGLPDYLAGTVVVYDEPPARP
jgi:uncharacterized RDD family membrane protein YckC